MIPIRITSILNALLLSLPIVIADAGPGPCHPYPGAVAEDCLELIGQHLSNDSETPCTGKTGLATLTLRNCSIVTKCGSGETAVVNDDAVRRALTTIGKCALNDRGSISGYYVADSGAKTCYMYPGQ